MENLSKVFVGNVPFNCSQKEFEKCFENMEGYVRSDIIYKQGTNLSRGFGFVTFNNSENANNLIKTGNIIFKDRQLRFTEYTLFNVNNVNNVKFKNDKNLLIVKNLDETISRDKLYEIFSEYGNVGRYFIITDVNTGTLKNSAIIEIIDNSVYEKLLSMKYIKYGDTVMEICKWVNIVNKTNIMKKNSKQNYQMKFNYFFN